jgi:hypothetical protein
VKEQELYRVVEKFLRRNFGCFHVTKKPTGTKHGLIDVVGLRQSSGRYGGSAEVIAVEVKATAGRFLNSAGQALGYSVMADRCYLAVGGKTLNEEIRELAAQLNIGLIRVNATRCEILLTSPQYRPVRTQKLELIRKLRFVECVMCGTLRPRDEMMNSEEGAIHVAAQKAQGFRYRLTGKNQSGNERRYLCHDCALRWLSESNSNGLNFTRWI